MPETNALELALEIGNLEPDHDMEPKAILDCGWGRLIFAHTFDSAHEIAEVLEDESKGQRDVAFYVRDPHVVLASAPQALFLDPSHSFRLDLLKWRSQHRSVPKGLVVREATPADEKSINRLYLSRSMVPVTEGFCATQDEGSAAALLVAVDEGEGDEVVGVAMAVDHVAAFGDPDNGSSLWAVAVDPQAHRPGIGEALVTAVADRLREAGRSFLDLSVMHDNEEAIGLYRKLGFKRIQAYSVKRKNPINEKLFVGPQADETLNIYAQIIVDEARRRGIAVEIEDAEAGLFRLSLGGRAVSCRESLSDLTSAVALSRCDDKRLTGRLLSRAGLNVPEQILVLSDDQALKFLVKHRHVVVKPARGEMGHGVSVDLTTPGQVVRALARAREQCDDVIMERYIEGEDLRIIVIDDAVVAAAIRRPPSVLGDGVHSVIELIDKQSRRRSAATEGESSIPLDEETERCVQSSGHEMLDVLNEGETVTVRKTANLHTGGTIHDVTADLHPELADAAVMAARALDIPVVGFDFIVSDPSQPHYTIIEANERAGLANHEPQPTAERFIDYLFPQTRAGQDIGGTGH